MLTYWCLFFFFFFLNSYYSSEAGDVLGTADKVQKALEGAKMSQEKAGKAIDQVQKDIKNAKEDLEMVSLFIYSFEKLYIDQEKWNWNKKDTTEH